MSTAFTGYHLNIDPQLLDINHQPSEDLKEHAQINVFHGSSSPQNFARDVDQAVLLRNRSHPPGNALEDVPSTPTNLSPSRPSLNPLATPFCPNPPLETPPTYASSEIAYRRALAPIQTAPFQPYQYGQLQANDRSSPHQNGLWGSNALGSPFDPHNHSGPGIQPARPPNFGPYFQQTNNTVFGQPPAIALFQEDDRFAHAASNSTTMAPSAQNLALLPTNEDPFQTMHQWNQTTYQGPLALTSQTQMPPTPASSGRRRRTESVALSINSMQTGIGAYQCNVCPKTFLRRHQLTHHQRWHEKSKTCPVCGQPFAAAKDVRRHMSAKHTKDEKHLLCNILGCKYSHVGFRRMDHLKRHNERVHPGNPWTPPASASHAGG